MGALREELWKESVGEVREESFTEFIQVMVFFFILSGGAIRVASFMHGLGK